MVKKTYNLKKSPTKPIKSGALSNKKRSFAFKNYKVNLENQISFDVKAKGKAREKR